MFIPDSLYGVIGWPLAQTLSPLIHNTGFQELQIPSAYLAWPVEPDQLETFLRSMRLLKIKGASVTIPHKQSVLPYLDNISEVASLAGAVNTLFWRDGDLCGDNTDVIGFLAPLKDISLDALDILLLGAGGAAHAAAAAIKHKGCRQVRVATNGDKRHIPLAERFGFTPISWKERYQRPADMVINATPLGMKGKYVDETPYDFKIAPAVENGYAYDLVYNPLQTLFLRQAEMTGRIPISGVQMFLGQGNAQFKLWTGQNLPAAAGLALEKALKN